MDLFNRKIIIFFILLILCAVAASLLIVTLSLIYNILYIEEKEKILSMNYETISLKWIFIMVLTFYFFKYDVGIFLPINY